MEKISYLGTKLGSFQDACAAVSELLRVPIYVKAVERITEQIGTERVAERDAAVTAWSDLPLMQRDQAPPGVNTPQVVAVLADGGRYQTRDKDAEANSHWHEYKAGQVQHLDSVEHETDPCPQIPDVYLDRGRMSKLASEITQLAAATEDSSDRVDGGEPERSLPPAVLLPECEVRPHGYEPPKIVDRDVVATVRDSRQFGRQLATRAWELGLFAALRKAWVSDGQNWLSTEWERHFKPYGFIPILDFIHALSRIYAAAMAGHSPTVGWPTYTRWIQWVWSGQVTRVIAELAARQQELGVPPLEAGETCPARIVSSTLTYLQNQQGRMNYPEYRRLGFPITSAHMESTVKLLNRRIKGTEKYWTRSGAEAVLQLAADHLCTSQPLDAFWANRQARQTGTRCYSRAQA